MKKIYSIFFATLIICLCVININTAYAKSQNSGFSTNLIKSDNYSNKSVLTNKNNILMLVFLAMQHNNYI